MSAARAWPYSLPTIGLRGDQLCDKFVTIVLRGGPPFAPAESVLGCDRPTPNENLHAERCSSFELDWRTGFFCGQPPRISRSRRWIAPSQSPGPATHSPPQRRCSRSPHSPLNSRAEEYCRALPFELSVMTPKFEQEQLSYLAGPDLAQLAIVAPLSDNANARSGKVPHRRSKGDACHTRMILSS